MTYEVALTNFSGPLDLLLRLVERSKMPIEKILVSDITDQYIEKLPTLEGVSTAEMSRFLALAATLLHLKSRSLVARDDPQEELQRFEEQLELYSQYRQAASQIATLWRHPNQAFTRGPLERITINELNLTNLTLASVRRSYLKVIQRNRNALHHLPEPQLSLSEIKQRLHQTLSSYVGTPANLNEIISLQPSPHEAAATFLAALEMWRQGEVELEQTAEFETIRVRYA